VLVYAPEAGSGTKVKILEAFALGAPVVTNAHGVEGIRARDGVHVSIGNDDESLIARTVALLRDPALRKRQREAARAFIATDLAPPAALDRLEEVYGAIGAYRGAA
jgi:glycosyltransferase involved in cell wall biosynthesis